MMIGEIIIILEKFSFVPSADSEFLIDLNSMGEQLYQYPAIHYVIPDLIGNISSFGSDGHPSHNHSN
jgi:hypothetical protein